MERPAILLSGGAALFAVTAATAFAQGIDPGNTDCLVNTGGAKCYGAPPGPPGLPITEGGTTEPTGDQAAEPQNLEAAVAIPSSQIVRCHDHDRVLATHPTYSDESEITAAVKENISTSSSSPIPPPPPVQISPEAAIADYLATGPIAGMKPASFEAHISVTRFKTYVSRVPDPLHPKLSVIWAAVNLRQLLSGNWQVIGLAACGEYLSPATAVHVDGAVEE